MASTGSGKTLANARIMNALADPVTGMRCVFAMGLRTLTRQTGAVFRDVLGCDDSQLAVLAGDGASRALQERQQEEAEYAAKKVTRGEWTASSRLGEFGSESAEELLEDCVHVDFDMGTAHHPLLRRALADPRVRALLVAPLLVCTIDHLMPATESPRGGRQIAPMLRLMSGDLVLDEPDDFDLADLPALTRLVHWAGMLGSRVLLSSATLPPALVLGLFEAYRSGRSHHERNCKADPSNAEVTPNVCCAWIDEWHQVAHDCPDDTNFADHHARFSLRRHEELTVMAKEPRRRAAVIDSGMKAAGARALPMLAEVVAEEVMRAALGLHDAHHSLDRRASGLRRVSFGLIRIANIEPLYEVALALFRRHWPEHVQVHLCVYHARHPLIVRSAIEQHLDRALKRHDADKVFDLPEIRARLDANRAADHLFVVLGSPITEVGRDHDYDWAIVEPSSMRSLIQLAGRVRRHRMGAVSQPNILILDHNFRHFLKPTEAAFQRPGFEADEERFRLHTHDMRELLPSTEKDAIVLDARPRIVEPSPLGHRSGLADLEHARLRAQMLPELASVVEPVPGTRRRGPPPGAHPSWQLNASTWWHASPADALSTGVLQQQQPFRAEQPPFDIELVLLPDAADEITELHQIERVPRGSLPETRKVEISKCARLPDEAVRGPRISGWGETDYLDALRELSETLNLSMVDCAQRFGTVSVPDNQSGWRYHPLLGFAKRRQNDPQW